LLPGIRHVTVDPHGDRDFDGQPQRLEVEVIVLVLPCLQDVPSEPHRLYVGAAQVQPPDLVDDQAAQVRIVQAEETVLGLEMMQG
jgi:hypothetical protein